MIQIKSTKRELVTILKGLLEVQDLPGVEFGMAVAQNLKLLQDKLQDIEDMGQVSPEFLAIAQKISQLTNDKQVEEAQKLENDNMHLLNERKKQLTKVEEALEKKASIKLHKISRRTLPQAITGKQIYSITKLLE